MARLSVARVPQRAPPVVRGLKRRPKTATGKADLALRLVRAVAARAESKVNTFISQNNDFFPINLTFNLNQIAQGDGINQRTGLRVNLERLDVHLRLSSYVQSNAQFRIIVLQDLQQVTGTAPPILSVLQNSRVTAMYEQSQRNRWLILKDQTISMEANYVGQDMAKDYVFSLRRFAQAGRLEWTDGTTATVTKNGLWMFVLGDYSVAGANNTAFALGDAQCTVEALTHFADV